MDNCVPKIKQLATYTLAIALIAFGAQPGFASNEVAQEFTYQGQFFNAAGTAPLLDNVDLTLQILDPSGTCLLYSEVQNGINLATTVGTFAVQVGSLTGNAKRVTTVGPNRDPGLAMNQIFNNTSNVRLDDSGTTNTCIGGYTPGAVDGRVLRVIVDDLTTSSIVTLTPDLPIGAAPQAMTSQTLQGIPASGFLKTDVHATQANIDILVASLGGTPTDASSLHMHDSLYVKLGGGTLTGVLNGTAITTTGNITDGGTLAVTGATTLSNSFTENQMVAPALSSANTGTIYFDSTTKLFEVSQNGGAYSALATVGSLGSYLPLAGGTLTGPVSGTAITTSGNITDGGNLSVTGTSTLTGNSTVGGTLGVTGQTILSNLSVTGAFQQNGEAAPAISFAGVGRIYFDSTANLFEVSQNGGAYSPLATNASVAGSFLPLAGGTLTGALTGTAITTSGNVVDGGTLGVTGASTLAGLSATGITDSGTLAVTGASTLTGATTLGNSLTQNQMAAPALSAANTGVIYFDSTAKVFEASQNGGAYSPLATNASVSGSYLPLAGGTVTGPLGVTGASTFGNTLGITGATTLANSLTESQMAAPALSAANTGTIYFDSTTKTFQVSQNGSAYAPMAVGGTSYLPLSGGTLTGLLTGTAVTTSGNVIDGGSLSVATTLGVTGASTLAGLSATSISDSGTLAVTGTSTLTGAATLGNSITQNQMAAPGLSAANTGAIYFDSTAKVFEVSQNGSAYSPLATTGSLGSYLPLAGGTLTGLLTGTAVTTSGNIVDGGTLGVTGASTLAGLSATSVTDSGTLAVTGTSTLTGAATLGNSLTQNQMAAPGLSAANTGAIYFDSTAKVFEVSQNGSAYSPLATTGALGSYLPLAGGTLTGLLTGTAVTTSGNIVDGGTLGVTGASTLAGLSATSVTDSGTLAVTGTSTLTGAATLGNSLTQNQMAAPGLSAANTGAIYFDSTAKVFEVSQNGGGYSPMATTASVNASYLPLAGGTLTGLLTGTAVTTSGNVIDGGTLAVTGASTLTGSTTLGNSLTQNQMAAPALSAANTGAIYFDSTAKVFEASQNGSAYSPLVTNASLGSTYLPLAGGTLTGALSGTTVSTSSNITDAGNLTVGGVMSVPGGVGGTPGIYFSSIGTSDSYGAPIGIGLDTHYNINAQVATTGFKVVTSTGNVPFMVATAANGNRVGIGNNVTPAATLDVAGQIHAQVFSNGGSTAIDWNNGNVQTTSAVCSGVSTQFTFANMLEGGSYTLIVTGSATGTCNFTVATSVTPAGSTGFSFVPANAVPTASTSTVYTFLRAGNVIYVSWITGFPAAS